jgi:adenine phosphoribosyltransferase
MDLKKYIREVPDFPKPGILFYDINTLVRNGVAWSETIDRLSAIARKHEPHAIAGIESRGFLVASAVARDLGCGIVLVRKQGKLPGDIVAHTYDLEYGTDTVEVQADAIQPGQRVVVLDDLLATGGTLAAAITLLRRVGADVRAAACIIELTFLGGRQRLPVPFEALVAYSS